MKNLILIGICLIALTGIASALMDMGKYSVDRPTDGGMYLTGGGDSGKYAVGLGDQPMYAGDTGSGPMYLTGAGVDGSVYLTGGGIDGSMYAAGEKDETVVGPTHPDDPTEGERPSFQLVDEGPPTTGPETNNTGIMEWI